MNATVALTALKVLILAGGIDASENHHSHYVHVTRLLEVLDARGVPAQDVAIFWADGVDPAPDRSVRRERPSPDAWLIADTRVDRDTAPEAEQLDTRFPDRAVRPAQRAALQAWFEEVGPTLGPDDTLLVAVTDHGEADPDGGFDTRINLWGETWSTEQLLEDLGPVPTATRVVLWMSQCHSGGFAELFRRRENLCGAFSATPDRVAYGCYPELAERDDVGHFLRFLEALAEHGDIARANDAVLLSDDAPDTPHLTSDVLLWGALERGAEQKQADLARFVDARLDAAAPDDPSWALLARLSAAYGLGVLDGYARVEGLLDELGAARFALEAWTERWKAALDQARKLLSEPVLRRMKEPRGARARARARKPAIEAVDAASRKRVGLRARLETLRSRVEGGDRIRAQIDLQEAATIRAAYLLGRLAGPTVLTRDERARLEALRACETTPVLPAQLDAPPVAGPGAPPAPRAAGARVPAAVESLRPGYLGLNYRDGTDGVAVVTEALPASPAAAVDLRAGDEVVAVDGWQLERNGGLRESVLLANPGSAVVLTVKRGRETLEVSAVAAPMPLPPPPPRVGEVVPRLRLTALEPGTTLPPIGEGRRVVLFFWATTCKPCKAALPALAKWADARGAEVIAITREDAADVRRWLRRKGQRFPFPVALDPHREATRLFAVDSTPVFVLVDASGRFADEGAGFEDAVPLR